ncbi:TPA: SMEK domain-containing protein [Stenotrophomonas maltophilia]|nr:SMEK domain-containing protein [Stenotrophomonas maltophilia]HDS1043678.1 SMEK domain-containing protein [Stenotrophomonas maltophilia]
MITRGHYIGEIVDEFSAIASQVKMRSRLGMIDLTVFCENFFRDLLNCLLHVRLRNLNEDRSNEPGLDLGDPAKALAIQVTCTATAQKINGTLSKITMEQKQTYKNFVVLCISGRQQSYSLNEELSTELGFTTDDIWDMNSLARKAVDLEIDELQSLHRLMMANVRKVRLELEVPDEKGVYPTNGYDKWEGRIKPSIGDGNAFATFCTAKYDLSDGQIDPAKIHGALMILGKQLRGLPRVTREFLAELLERRNLEPSGRFPDGYAHLLYGTVKREFHGDVQGELEILEHFGLVTVRAEDTSANGAAEIGILLSTENEDLAHTFLSFVESKGLSLRRVIGEGDLSAF